MEDWDLLAVVRGRSNNYAMELSPISYSNSSILIKDEMELSSPIRSCFGPLLRAHQDYQDDLLFNTYPHLFETATAFDELEELYKPFYHSGSASSSVNVGVSSLSSPSSSVPSPNFVSFANKQAEEHASPIKPKVAKEPANKYKKRKNQQKRVVKEVREDGLGSDMWAWRKYGQKPIKGSPFPRSYYRCSSSKGCSARKQVERSPSSPDLFIITYTADHTHPHPTRRNSLAGTSRSKFPLGQNPGPMGLSSIDTNPTNKPNNIDSQELSELLLLGQISNKKMKVEDYGDDNDNDNGGLFASLEELERGLQEIEGCDNIDDDHQSELGLFNFDANNNSNSNNSWFVDQYSTSSNATVTGAC